MEFRRRLGEECGPFALYCPINGALAKEIVDLAKSLDSMWLENALLGRE